MMVKSFSQDGYSSMKKSPSYILRGRGMSAAASNEALAEAMRSSGFYLKIFSLFFFTKFWKDLLYSGIQFCSQMICNSFAQNFIRVFCNNTLKIPNKLSAKFFFPILTLIPTSEDPNQICAQEGKVGGGENNRTLWKLLENLFLKMQYPKNRGPQTRNFSQH